MQHPACHAYVVKYQAIVFNVNFCVNVCSYFFRNVGVPGEWARHFQDVDFRPAKG